MAINQYVQSSGESVERFIMEAMGDNTMRLRNIGIALLLTLVGSSQAFSAETNSKSLARVKAQVIHAVETIFHAAGADNLTEFDSVITPEFYLFDSGVRFNYDSLMPVVKQLHASGKHFEWHVTDPDVHIEGSTAWVAYVNNGVITDASGSTRVQWLESAVLTRRPEGWMLVFMHSTLVPPRS